MVSPTGSEVTFDQVLLVEKDAGDIVAGAPYVANARVVGVVDGEARGPKLRVFKKKRRKGFRKTRGNTGASLPGCALRTFTSRLWANRKHHGS